ncbi:MAG: hypothetical protein AAF590_07290 [Pseudomonadota bacterium]
MSGFLSLRTLPGVARLLGALSFIVCLTLLVALPRASSLGVDTLGADMLSNDVTLILERRGGAIELFVGGRADVLSTSLDAELVGAVNDEGHVQFADFFSGTWTIAEDLFGNVTASVENETLPAHAMSLMLHPLDAPSVPFYDSVDGVLAVSICSVEDPAADLTLDDNALYAGFILYTDDNEAPLTLSRPMHAGAPLMLNVRDYTDGALTTSYSIMWNPSEPLTLAVAGQV